ncbi:MAG: hypothetical protein AAF334_08295, partial [Pseudomonadota bacterium]
DWIRTWSAVVLTGNMGALTFLCTADMLRAATPPSDLVNPGWESHCALLSAVTTFRDEDAELLMGALRDATPTDGLDRALSDRQAAARTIAAGIVDPDAAAVLDAIESAFHSNVGSWETQNFAHHPNAAWPLEAMALAQIAVHRGVIDVADITTLAAPVPAFLLESEHRPETADVHLRWPDHSVLSPDEAHWFLDLRRLPRERRTHELVQEGDRLLAIYQTDAGLGPRAIARFELADHLADAACPPALDAGELLLVAERLGRTPSPSDPSEMPAYCDLVVEALAATDAALARIPAGADRVPRSTLVSDAALGILSEDPGRFGKERMQAYRGGVAQALERARRPAATVEDAREGALNAAAIVAESVRPMLNEMPKSKGAQIARDLVPAIGDFGAVFFPRLAEQAAAGYRRAWPDMPEVDPLDRWNDLEVHAASAGLFQTSNLLSDRFPGAYAKIADKLEPHCVWLCWRYVTQPDGSGAFYDGLVWTGGRWVWFPKPWRYFD